VSAYYPVFLDLAGQRCVVLGGNEAAAHKARGLVDAGADVTAIAADPCAALEELPVRLVRRQYQRGDLAGAHLAIDTIGIPEAREEASAEGVLLNVMDQPAQCDFIAPAVVKRGDLQLAISTAGESPFLAGAVRARLEADYGEEWAEMTRLLGSIRRRLRRRGVPLETQKRVYRDLLASNVLDLLREGAVAAARRQTSAVVRQTLATCRPLSR